jgi:hypothetical protein
VVLKGVFIWRNRDEVTLTSDSAKTLDKFMLYRESLYKDHPHDSAFLLTTISFDESVIGKAPLQSMCKGAGSGGIVSDHSEDVDIVATTLAHELGHNFGMDHDNEDCYCPGSSYKGCIMSPSSFAFAPKQWSSCSRENLRKALDENVDHCLKNKPEKLFASPTCGNGFVEPGEECDCGLPENCNTKCCDPKTCKFKGSAVCATGSCCDLSSCKPYSEGMLFSTDVQFNFHFFLINLGKICRSSNSECDLPEKCNGKSEFCPEDVFKRDTEECQNGFAYCLDGACVSHDSQCRMIWGRSAASFDACYDHNSRGDRTGNCGYDHFSEKYFGCREGDRFCGRLQCKATESSQFRDPVFRRADSPMTAKTHAGHLGICHTIVYPGLIPVDFGLTPDGAKCGEGKVCRSQQCISLKTFKRERKVPDCPDCNGNGVCNSKGNCHCDDGYAPPYCIERGSGGSSEISSDDDNDVEIVPDDPYDSYDEEDNENGET